MKESGSLLYDDPGPGRPREMATVMCCHCGRHWAPRPGSGRTRGWCQNCQGYVCSAACADCVPLEAYLENLEAGRDPGRRRIIG